MALLHLGTSSLTTSSGRDALAALRQKYLQVGLEHRRKFLSGYAAFKTADDLFQQYPEALEAALSEASIMVANDIAANRIYDVDLVTIRTALDERAETVRDGFDRVQDQYVAILGRTAELDAQRTAARENRGRIIGGGFGVEGAAKGIAEAAVANAAIGLIHGLANVTGKAASAVGDKRKKRELLTDPKTKATLADFLCRVVMQGYKLVASTVNESTATRVFDVVSDEAQRKAAAIVENVTSGRVPEAEAQATLVQALELDPFNDLAWKTWLERFGDKDGSVGASAKALGVAVAESHKAKLISQRKASLPWSTPEECRESCQTLEQYAASIAFPFDTERGQIDTLTADLDRTRRTFNGVLYSTIAEVSAARATHEDVMNRTVEGVLYATAEEAKSACAQGRAKLIAAAQASNPIEWATLGYRRCRDVSGRSSRQEFWIFLATSLAIHIAMIILIGIGSIDISASDSLTVVSIIVSIIELFFTLYFLICLVTIQIRRFHDLGLSAGFTLLNLIPYIGWAIVLLIMILPGNRGDNSFGPDPISR